MNASVVTFSVQVGSGGFETARMVAEKLGYHYHDWQITSQGALLLDLATEIQGACGNTFADRLMLRLAAADLMGEEVPPAMLGHEIETVDAAVELLSSNERREVIERLVLSLAARGHCVIVGHAAQAILENTPDVLRVLIRGSEEKRAATIADQQKTSLSDAKQSTLHSDQLRDEFFRRAYGIDWLDSNLYDVTVWTDRISSEAAADMIVSLLPESKVRETITDFESVLVCRGGQSNGASALQAA